MSNKQGLEKTLNMVISVGFVTFLVGLLAFCAVIPDKEKSEMENREFQSMPKFSVSKIMDGNYMKSFEVYASDHVVGRNSWVSIKNNLDVYSGKKDNGSAYFGEDGYLFPIEKVQEDQFEKNLEYTKTFVEEIKKQNSDLAVSVLLAPTSTEVCKKKMPNYATVVDQQRLLSMAEESLGSAFSGVAKRLREHEEEYVYYKTDHHWTSLGAYYAYAAWAEHAGIEPQPLASFDVETVSKDFYGTTYSKAVGVNSQPDTIERFSNEMIEGSRMEIVQSDGTKKSADIFDAAYLTTRDKYAYFLSGNNPVSVIETPVENQKRLLVIKDSYANSFIPFAAAHFEKIYIVDLRYYKENVKELIKEKQISNVLLLYNVVQYSNDRNLVYLALKK